MTWSTGCALAPSLSFCLDVHPMALHAESLRRFRLVPSTRLHEHVGRSVLMAGMYTTGKPVHNAKDEPMQFATFDDGAGLIEAVLFPDIYRLEVELTESALMKSSHDVLAAIDAERWLGEQGFH